MLFILSMMDEFNLRPQSGLYKAYHVVPKPIEPITYAKQYVPKLHDIGEDNLSYYEPNDVIGDDFEIIEEYNLDLYTSYIPVKHNNHHNNITTSNKEDEDGWVAV